MNVENNILGMFQRNKVISKFIEDMKDNIKESVKSNKEINEAAYDFIEMKNNFENNSINNLNYQKVKEGFCIAIMRACIENYFIDNCDENAKLKFTYNYFNNKEKRLIENVLVRIVMNELNEKIKEKENE